MSDRASVHKRSSHTENRGEEGASPGADSFASPPNRPRWRGAALHGLVAGIALALLAGVILKATVGETLAYFAVALLVYTPISYHSDSWLYRRRS